MKKALSRLRKPKYIIIIFLALFLIGLSSVGSLSLYNNYVKPKAKVEKKESNDTKKQTDTQNEPTSSTPSTFDWGVKPTSSKNNSVKGSAIAPTVPTPSTPAPAPTVKTCNTGLASTYLNQYSNAILNEDSRYDQEVNSIKESYSARGLLNSGMCEEALAQAKIRHDSNLDSLYSAYVTNLASVNCSP